MTTVLPEVRGSVHQPAEPSFAAAHRGFNLAETHRPDLVVVAADRSDVTTAVRHAADHGLPVRVQATGHGIGTPMAGGLLLSTARLQSMSLDPERRTVSVEAGVRWADVISAAGRYGLATLCGSSPTVGVVGYTLGGGMGPMARTFGFASDRVRSLTLVGADAAPVAVDRDSEPDLFWALRGGKPELGIVTQLEFELVPLASYYGGGIFFPGAQAATLLHTWAQWAPTLPETVSTSIALLRLPDDPGLPEPLRGTLSVHLRYVHIGDDDTGAALLAPMRGAGTPLLDLVRRCAPEEVASVHQDPTDAMPARDDALLLDELPEAAIDALLATAGPESEVPLIIVELRIMGGALSRPVADSAAAGREAAFNLNVIGAYPPPLRAAVSAASTRVLDALRPWASGGRLINFQGYARDPGQIRAAWPAATVDRLEQLHAERDPEGLFRFGYHWRS